MTREEENGTLKIVLALTPAMTSWNPHDSIFQKQEESMVDLRGDIKHAQNCKFVVSSIVSRTLDPSLFTYDLIKLEQSSPYSTYYVKSVKSFDGKYSLLDPAVLART